MSGLLADMASEAGRHTIILMQKGPTNSTRTYYDFGSVKKAVEGVVAMYENKLKDSFRGAGELTYDGECVLHGWGASERAGV